LKKTIGAYSFAHVFAKIYTVRFSYFFLLQFSSLIVGSLKIPVHLVNICQCQFYFFNAATGMTKQLVLLGAFLTTVDCS